MAANSAKTRARRASGNGRSAAEADLALPDLYKDGDTELEDAANLVSGLQRQRAMLLSQKTIDGLDDGATARNDEGKLILDPVNQEPMTIGQRIAYIDAALDRWRKANPRLARKLAKREEAGRK